METIDRLYEKIMIFQHFTREEKNTFMAKNYETYSLYCGYLRDYNRYYKFTTNYGRIKPIDFYSWLTLIIKE